MHSPGTSFIITQTPYRISFFGGGTDYPAWYRDNLGAVLATSINKYCYLLCRWLPPFFEHKHRVVYSQIETPQEIDEIRHPAVRETLKFIGITNGIEIHHASDLPARAGMGTSSAFTVGLLHALYTLTGVERSKMNLALDTIHIEQEKIKEAVGSQDQVTSVFGGFNRIGFNRDEIKVEAIANDRLKELEKYLMLFFTGFSRTASQIATEQIKQIKVKEVELKAMYQMVEEGVRILTSHRDLSNFGKLLGETWKIKKRLSPKISTDYIDYIYANAIRSGATGGKLLGAGGGGFILLFVDPDLQLRVRERLSSLLLVPFRFEDGGSQVVFNGYS